MATVAAPRGFQGDVGLRPPAVCGRLEGLPWPAMAWWRRWRWRLWSLVWLGRVIIIVESRVPWILLCGRQFGKKGGVSRC